MAVQLVEVKPMPSCLKNADTATTRDLIALYSDEITRRYLLTADFDFGIVPWRYSRR